MKRIYDFLTALSANNDRVWFNSNKQWYQSVHEIFTGFALDFISALSAFDPSVKGLELKDCTYRIYRDIRFSLDKSPYKTHMGVYVCPGGKKTWHSGYYLHIEPDNCMLVIGAYMPPKPAVDSIREDIYGRSDEFMDALGKISGFEWDYSRELKKIPSGFPNDTPVARFLRQRDFCLIAPIPEENLRLPLTSFLDYAVGMFRPAVDFNAFINRAMYEVNY